MKQSIGKKDFADKLNSVTAKNTGYEDLKQSSTIHQNIDSNVSSLHNLDISDIVDLTSAPIVSCDVERIFSEPKNILADFRQNFKFENLLHNAVIKCNRRL